VVLVLRQAQDEDPVQAAAVENLILSLSKDEVFAAEAECRSAYFPSGVKA
jgi:hypothetical protein